MGSSAATVTNWTINVVLSQVGVAILEEYSQASVVG
jgi:hypothetical protein